MPADFDSCARYYDKALAPLERLALARWRREAMAELPSGAEILEVGAGTGANFGLYPPSRRAVSSEPSQEMIRVAETRRHTNLLVRADAQLLPFPEDSFDAAFATLVFCSVPDPLAGFTELRRVVRPGGRVVLLEHVRPNGILGHAFDLMERVAASLAGDHFNRRTAEIAAASGLKVLSVRERAAGIVNLIVCEV